MTQAYPLSAVWRAAVVMGLISSTFSTLVSQFTAGRLGRDAIVDWMIVGSIALREHGLQAVPTWWTTLAGILVHQSADFWWDMVFFVLLSRWSNRLGPWALLGIAVPWAIFTSGFEWFFLVPVFPLWWSVFPLEQAWWLGLLVHTSAASTFPLYPYIRDRFAEVRHPGHARFAKVWGSLGVLGAVALGLWALAAENGRELPHPGENIAYDQSYMIRMSAHHLQGIELAEIAAATAQDPTLRALARMMVATQHSEIEIFRKWWRSWFEGELPVLSEAEHAGMPGMLSTDSLNALAQASGPAFDQRFVAMMSQHHGGAIEMADEAMRLAGDLRLRLMSHGIRHQQQGDINLMHGMSGMEAVRRAARATFFTDAAPISAPSAEHAHQ